MSYTFCINIFIKNANVWPGQGRAGQLINIHINHTLHVTWPLGYYNCWPRLGEHQLAIGTMYIRVPTIRPIRASRYSAHDSLKYTTATAFAIRFHALFSGREQISKMCTNVQSLFATPPPPLF